jgi:hypothetical protein
MRSSLWGVVLGLSVATLPLQAQQEGPGRGNASLSCQDAVALVRASASAPQSRQAVDRLSSGCGEEGYSAVAFRIRQERVSRDLTLLVGLSSLLQRSPKGAFLQAVLDVAQDRSASMEARGAALFALTRVTHPDVSVDYQGIMSGVDRWGLPTKSCFNGHIAGRSSPSAISPADVSRVEQIASALHRDTTQPSGVRSAASCILS